MQRKKSWSSQKSIPSTVNPIPMADLPTLQMVKMRSSLRINNLIYFLLHCQPTYSIGISSKVFMSDEINFANFSFPDRLLKREWQSEVMSATQVASIIEASGTLWWLTVDIGHDKQKAMGSAHQSLTTVFLL